MRLVTHMESTAQPKELIPSCLLSDRKCSWGSVPNCRFWPRRYSTWEMFRINPDSYRDGLNFWIHLLFQEVTIYELDHG